MSERVGQKSISTHILSGIGVSTLLSVSFYFLFGVFVLGGFLIWSVACGIAGGLIGIRFTPRLWATLIVTAFIRIAVFLLMTDGIL